jgi:hypothetical protein
MEGLWNNSAWFKLTEEYSYNIVTFREKEGDGKGCQHHESYMMTRVDERLMR